MGGAFLLQACFELKPSLVGRGLRTRLDTERADQELDYKHQSVAAEGSLTRNSLFLESGKSFWIHANNGVDGWYRKLTAKAKQLKECDLGIGDRMDTSGIRESSRTHLEIAIAAPQDGCQCPAIVIRKN